jgi:hypothetical protein
MFFVCKSELIVPFGPKIAGIEFFEIFFIVLLGYIVAFTNILTLYQIYHT